MSLCSNRPICQQHVDQHLQILHDIKTQLEHGSYPFDRSQVAHQRAQFIGLRLVDFTVPITAGTSVSCPTILEATSVKCDKTR
jgi:hypothetical protein